MYVAVICEMKENFRGYSFFPPRDAMENNRNNPTMRSCKSRLATYIEERKGVCMYKYLININSE